MQPGSSPLLTDLCQLRDRGFKRVFLAGFAFDFCVCYFAEDACREGFQVMVVEDACRGIAVDVSVAATRESLNTLGMVRTTTEELMVRSGTGA